MQIIDIVDVDVTNYKKTSMFIVTPRCSMKCNRDCGKNVCQNEHLLTVNPKDYDNDKLITRYKSNPLTHAVVVGGMEPFDTFDSLYNFIKDFRATCSDDIVIYSGYNENEIAPLISRLKQFDNIIVKYGRFQPGATKHYDEILGVNLASDNQYAKVLVS